MEHCVTHYFFDFYSCTSWKTVSNQPHTLNDENTNMKYRVRYCSIPYCTCGVAGVFFSFSSTSIVCPCVMHFVFADCSLHMYLVGMWYYTMAAEANHQAITARIFSLSITSFVQMFAINWGMIYVFAVAIFFVHGSNGSMIILKQW